jgi:hypothetical protein
MCLTVLSISSFVRLLAFLTFEALAFEARLAFEALFVFLLLFFVISNARIIDIIILAQRDWIIQQLSSFKSKKRGRADFVEGQGCPFRMDYTYGWMAGLQVSLQELLKKYFSKIPYLYVLFKQ